MALFSNKTLILLNLLVPQSQKPNPDYALTEEEQQSVKGKTIVFTGGTDGIGKVSVKMLYSMGANVVLLGRNETKGNLVIEECTTASSDKNNGTIVFEHCDQSSMDSVKACAEAILLKHNEIHVLVNCAGLNNTNQDITKDGFEMNWAVNYFGPYLLTMLLLHKVKERIVNVSTNTRFVDTIDYEDIEKRENFVTEISYAEAKLSLDVFSLDLADQLKDKGVVVHLMYPGYIKSNLLSTLEGFAKITTYAMNLLASPTEVGADRVVRLTVAKSFGETTGLYVACDDIADPHPEALLANKREQLKAMTEKALAKWL